MVYCFNKYHLNCYNLKNSNDLKVYLHFNFCNYRYSMCIMFDQFEYTLPFTYLDLNLLLFLLHYLCYHSHLYLKCLVFHFLLFAQVLLYLQHPYFFIPILLFSYLNSITDFKFLFLNSFLLFINLFL